MNHVKRDYWRSAMAVGLAVCLCASPGFAVADLPAIGTVVSPGAFRLNHATVRSNATLFEGAMVETGTAPARMALANGAWLELEPESTARVFGGRLMLERGATGISTVSGSAFTIAARGVTIQSEGSAAAGRIALIGTSRIEVAAVTGSFRVLNSRSMPVAIIAAGKALALEPQSMPGPARVTGRLVRQGGDYLLTDETTNVTMEVTGSAFTQTEFRKALGRRVQVTGPAHQRTAPVSGALQVIEVAQVSPAPPASGSVPGDSAPAGSGGAGGTAPAGAGGPAAGAGGGAASGAAISVAMIAIVGGVAAAAVVGGLAASGTLGGSTAAPLSR